MSYIHPAAVEHQRKRWTRPDAYRFAPPGSPEAKPPWERAEPAPADDAMSAAELDAFYAEHLQVRRQLADLKFELAFRRIFRKYSPDQPRDDRGRWTDGGNDASPEAEDNSPGDALSSDRRTQVAQLSPGATATDAGAQVFSPDRPGWHDYKAGPNLVCGAELRCSREEIADQLARVSVPGRDPSRPVQDLETSLVEDPRTGLPGGLVITTIEDDGLTITNQTTPLHALYNGVVVRSATQADDGAWHVTTRGFGNNVVPGMNLINQEQGPLIFGVLDRRMRENIERHHAKGFLALAVRRLVRGGHDGPRPLLAEPYHVR